MCRAERKDFILSKYQDVHFVRRSHSSTAAQRLGLQEATKSCDIYSLIQLYAQRTELSQPLHTHIQVHTGAHAYKYEHVYTGTNTHRYTYIKLYTGTYIQLHIQVNRHIQVYTQEHTHSYTCIQVYTQVHTCRYRHRHTDVYSYTQVYIDTGTHMYTHTLTGTHISRDTHRKILSFSLCVLIDSCRLCSDRLCDHIK